MPRCSEGSCSLPAGMRVSSGDTSLVSQHNPAMQDIASALGKSLDREGTGGMRSPLDMGGFPIINAAPGSYPTDLATVEQAASNGVPMDRLWISQARQRQPVIYFATGRLLAAVNIAISLTLSEQSDRKSTRLNSSH